ncbi:MAG TPA: CpaF family protein [Nitriliruptorales bacterium]
MGLTDRLARGREATAPADALAAAPATKGSSADPVVQLKARVHTGLLEALGPKLYVGVEEDELAKRVRAEVDRALASETLPLSAAERSNVVTEIIDDVLGYGPIEPYLRDETVTEVMVNGPEAVYIERDGHLHLTPARFVDDRHLRRTIEKIVAKVGRRIDESQPYVDARLADGSRVNAVIPPVAVDGPSLTIRKFAADPYQVPDLIRFGTLTRHIAEFLDACVRGRINILVSGGTGAGKTTTLNVLSSFIPHDERIITIEDAAELQLQQPHVIRLEYRPPNIEGKGEISIRQLVRNSLRMRPDRIVVGEVRGGEALDMLQAMNTGHDGSITTVHANSPRDVISRVETMVLMAGVDLPLRAIREQVAAGVQLIVHQSRLRDGSRRITHVSEITGMEGDVVTIQDIFRFDFGMGFDEHGRFLGHLKPTGIRPDLNQRLSDLGIELTPNLFEPEAFTQTPSARR